MTLYLIFIKKYHAFALVTEDGKSLAYLHEDDRAAILWGVNHGYLIRLSCGIDWEYLEQ